MKAAYIVSVLSIDDNGMAAYVIAAQDPASPNALYVCDFAVEPLGGDTFRTIGEKMDALARQCRAANDAGLFVRDDLVAQARHAGVWAQPIPKEFRAEERLLSVAGHVSSGLVLITSQVVEKAKTESVRRRLEFEAPERTSTTP